MPLESFISFQPYPWPACETGEGDMGAAPPFPSEGARRRRGPRGGIARGERRELVGGFGARGGAWRWPVRGGWRPAAVCVGGGGAPAADSGRARAWELSGSEGKVAG